MHVTTEDVERVAELANLELSSVEKVAILRDLNSVLNYFAELNEVDTTAVPAMAQSVGTWVDGEPQAAALQFRQDEIAPSLNRERLLDCAPDTDGVFFRVPKVIER